MGRDVSTLQGKGSVQDRQTHFILLLQAEHWKWKQWQGLHVETYSQGLQAQQRGKAGLLPQAALL